MDFLANGWQPFFKQAAKQESFHHLTHFLEKELQEHTVYPPQAEWFQAFEITPFNQVKVVILGQDPYHGEQQANGLSFSVKRGVVIPPSLRNIYQELEQDLGIKPASHGDLSAWARQGVLLMNTVLTVRAHQAHSHRGQGWEELTDYLIETLNRSPHPIVYILWGRAAQQKAALIDTTRHHIITSAHPSPLSAYRGFFGSRPFSKANQFLIETGQQPIHWELPQ